MSSRRTYRERRAYSARVMRFRRGVYAARRELGPGCLLLLLRLSDDMDARAIVSVPRGELADDLNADAPRITEWIAEAVAAGFLSRVRRGRPGVTAVYQGLVREAVGVRPGVPSQRYARADHVEVRRGVPHSEGQRYAPGGPQEVVPAGTRETAVPSPTPRRGSKEEREPRGPRADLTACEAHGWADCQDRECLDAADRRRA